MALLDKFNISNVSKQLNKINFRLSKDNSKPFPSVVLLSNYKFKKRFVKILPGGCIQGGFSKMIISLIDFSFVRSMCASCYSVKSPPAYDPISLFLLELFRYIDQYKNMDKFLEVLRDKDRGRAYRTYAGINDKDIPTKGTLSNFKARIGCDVFNKIFHTLVEIFYRLEMVTFNIIAHDGTLFPSRARYKGCTWFSDKCSCVAVNNVIGRVKKQIMYRLNNLNKVNIDKAFTVKCDCPYVPEEKEYKKNPRFEVLCLKLKNIDEKPTIRQNQTAMLFDVKQELDKHNLFIDTIRSNIADINLETGDVILRCPKIPKDTDAKIGVRRNPKNGRKQKIFGYNLVLSTSVEPDLKLELPVAATNIAGNGEEGKIIINNSEQIKTHHSCKTKVDIADAKYDIIDNYTCLRKNGSIPIIDYNKRNEKLTSQALRERGYDQNGWPFAPCGIVTRPNGFDRKRKRHTFCCFKQCLNLKVTGIKNIQKNYDIASCPYVNNKKGFSKHTYIKDNPRLINEIPRGSWRFKKLAQFRSASERVNSVIKEDLKIIEKPIVYNKVRADILAQIAAIALLLYRAFKFIVKISMLYAKYLKSNKEPAIEKQLQPHYLPQCILSLIQRE